jgi:DNA invertase Pin-like site-specific DNA recombinase/predicted nucleotidyltransferase
MVIWYASGMTIYGYARVSTDGQTLDAQLEALKTAGCEKIFREKVSGANADGAQLARLLAMIERGDVLIVSRLDRLARSTRDLLNILDALAQRGAAFRSLGDSWADTTTPHGRLMLTVLGGLAEFERELIRLRTGEGRTRAKARGVHMGRPPKLTPHQRHEALQALASGTATQADLVRRFNVSQSTISRLADKGTLALPASATPVMDAETERAVRTFMQRLEGKYPVREGILYGSRARGTHTPESDADIAVVLEGTKGNRYAVGGDMAGIAFDVMMETGILVEALPIWADEMKRPETFTNPALIENIRRDGLRL